MSENLNAEKVYILKESLNKNSFQLSNDES